MIHVGDGYQGFGTNFRPALLGQRADIETVMLKQFETDLVRNALREGVEQARATFASQLPSILQFR